MGERKEDIILIRKSNVLIHKTFIQISTPNIFVIKYVHVCDVNLATITGLYYT
jgi:hypothetical protein